MFDLVQVDSEWRISSLELLELINQIRVAEGLNKMMPSRFNRKVRDELEGDNLRWQKKSAVINQQLTNEIEFCELTGDQALRVGMREFKRVRAKVVERIQQLRLEVSQLKLIQQCGKMADHALELANEGKVKEGADLITLADKRYKPLSSQAGVTLNACKSPKRKIKNTGDYIGSLLQIDLFPE
ncbi:TPA: hypothetical protein ACGCGI_000489 [Escherichia coli]